MTELTPQERAKAAMQPPPARPRVTRRDRQAEQNVQAGTVNPGPAFTLSAPAPAVAAGPSAQQRLAARTAEQAFLPLVSKLAKFNEAMAEVELAVQQALAVGVARQGLELSLMQQAHKNGVDWSAVPESIRQLLAPAPAAPARSARRRADELSEELAEAEKASAELLGSADEGSKVKVEREAG